MKSRHQAVSIGVTVLNYNEMKAIVINLEVAEKI
ncbi:hypothetical protein NTGHW29_240017 [Candidatus Nitrotoga sp. HW29]|nr:hypothetical protein NTGHW29_240017 [Candidatus Nitrotoga sp. HW29]